MNLGPGNGDEMSKTIEKNDMGPFVGMDAKLVEAISRYGTPPYRGIVRIEVRDIGSYRFDGLPDNIDGWISWFKEARDAVCWRKCHEPNKSHGLAMTRPNFRTRLCCSRHGELVAGGLARNSGPPSLNSRVRRSLHKVGA